MAYSARTDLETALHSKDRVAVLLADETGSERTEDLAAAIARADEEIDGALGPFYPMPITGPVPAQVARWSACLALETLAAGKPAAGGGAIAGLAVAARGEMGEVAAGRRTVPGLARREATGTADEDDEKFTDESLRTW